MSDYAIETFDLTKRYGNTLAVDHVAMHVPQGAIYGFVGENGSGKTTIMRLLMNLANPNEGTYSLFGVSAKDKEIFKIRHTVSAIVEAPSLVPSMTAINNLRYACKYYGIKEDEGRINEVLKDVSLENTGKKKVKGSENAD